MKNKKKNNDNWWLIIAKDRSRHGYMPGKTKEEACLRFGLEVEKCSIKRVEMTEWGFIEQDQSEQGKLL